jgi:predicted adenylyl cyclase CyaB
MRNLEVKAKLTNLEEALERGASLTGGEPVILRQTDTYFEVPRGRLKLREEGDNCELIYYSRPDSRGPKASDFLRVKVAQPVRLKEILSNALSVSSVVEKVRRVFFYGSTRIHVDEVVGLGLFIELEVPVENPASEETAQSTIEKLLSSFPGVGGLIPCSYSDMSRHGGDSTH